MDTLFDVDLSREKMAIEAITDEVQFELIQNVLKAETTMDTLLATDDLIVHLSTHPIDEAFLKQLKPTELYNVMGAQLYFANHTKKRETFQQSCIVIENILEGFEKVRHPDESLHYTRQYIGILGRKLDTHDMGLHDFAAARLRKIVVSPEGWRTNSEIVCNITTRLADKALAMPVCKETLVELLMDQGASDALRRRHHKLHPAICQTLQDIIQSENDKKSLYEMAVTNSLDKNLAEAAKPVKITFFTEVHAN